MGKDVADIHKMDITHNGILAIKTNEIIPFAATWMDIQIVILSEVSQRNIIWHPLYEESKKK